MGRALASALAVVAVGGAAFLGARVPSSSTSSPSSGPGELRPGMTVSSNLKSPASVTYAIRLEQGDFLRVVVEQHGIDLIVSLLNPSGRELFTTDRQNGAFGPEPVEVVTQTTGVHRLRVSALRPGSTGRYTIRLEEPHRADARDQARARAAQAFAAGEALPESKDLVQAREVYRAALRDWREAQDLRGIADAQACLGRVADDLGEPEESRRSYREAVALYARLGDPEEIRLLIEIGKLSRRLAEPGAAEAAYLQALRLARRRGERLWEGEALNNLGVLYDSESKPRRALEAYDQALEVWKSLGNRAKEASTLHNMGVVYTVLGRLTQALEQLEQSLRLRSAAHDVQGEAATLTAMGWVQSLNGQHAEALRLYDEAIRLRRLVGDRVGEGVTLDRRGTTLVQMGRTAEALALYDRALAIFRPGGERRQEASTLANMGSLLVRIGDLRRGEQLLNAALSLLRQSVDRNGEAHVLLGLAHAARQRRDLPLALERVEEANNLVVSLREEAPGPDLRLSYVALRYGYRELWIDLLMELHAKSPDAGFDLRALEASERGRARGLLENLELGDAMASNLPDVTPRGLEARIRKLESLLLQPPEGGVPPEQLDEVERKLTVLLLERDRRRAERPTAAPAPRRQVLRDLRSLLSPDTLLLEYAMGEERSFLWLVSAEGLEATRILPGRKELGAQVLRARTPLEKGFKKSSQRPVQAALEVLGSTLLAPVADRLGDKRLLIVPDGVLHEVPFSALPVQPGGPPLVAGHEVAVAPSASTVVRIRRELLHRPPAPGDLALVAAPEFGSGENALASLPHTRTEAEDILRLLPDPSRSVALFSFDANRKAVLSGALDGNAIVHFATHAILDPEQPELSHLVLTMVDRSGRPVEGRLRAYEIRDLHLPADLVVLSACSTGVGRELRGEGPLGLSRAFLDAGAARVLVSLWDVQDQPTAELMKRFYRGLLTDQLPPAAALRQAQVSMARETRWAAPYYWAGFELQGEWR